MAEPASAYSALEAELYDLPELCAALVGILQAGRARYVHVDRKREPIEVLLYCTPGDVERISGILGAVGLRCAWGPREGEPGGRGWACFLPREVPAGGNP